MAGIFEELGVRPVLNAMGNRTLLGGSTPSAAVRALMDEAEGDYVNMSDLMDAVGEKIAEMIGAEAALVTSGCSAALAVGAAACMTGNDPEKIDQLPDTDGMPNEFIIQRQLRIKYDRSLTIPGGKLVEVGDAEETRAEHIEAAIGPRTAGLHYLAPGNRPGALPIEEVIRIGQAHNIPVIVDAAGEVYPTDKFGRYVKMGAKLAAYGAKYFGAVNSSGMLVGDKDLVEIARAHSFIGFESSTSRSIGRPMKVDRQEVVAVYAALREWLTMNHEDRLASYEVRVERQRAELINIPNLTMHDYPAQGPAVGLVVRMDTAKVGKTAGEVVAELKTGNPSIWVRSPQERPDEYPPGENGFVILMHLLKEGGEQVIAERLKEILPG
jgi:D-glucosaminate-6-phosphate ammonia-lyase